MLLLQNSTSSDDAIDCVHVVEVEFAMQSVKVEQYICLPNVEMRRFGQLPHLFSGFIMWLERLSLDPGRGAGFQDVPIGPTIAACWHS